MKKLFILFFVLVVGGCMQKTPDISKLVGKYENQSGNLIYVSEYNGDAVFFKQIFQMKPDNNLQYVYFDEKIFEIQKDLKKIDCEEGQNFLYEKCNIGGEIFKRKLFNPEIGKIYKIDPIMSEKQVRELAKNSEFPFSGGNTKLVDLEKLDSSLKIDIRYATDNNFMGFILYPDNKAFLAENVANSLVKASEELHKIGLGIVIYDAYRPWYVTKMFWEATPEAQRDFVADPSKGSRHNRGFAVDIGLYDLTTGKYLDMPSGFDEFSERAFPEYPGGTTLQRDNRNILIEYMRQQGFVVNGGEWWHYDYTGRKDAPVLNLDFVDIK